MSHTRRLLIATAIVLALLASACGSDDDDSAAPDTTGSETTEGDAGEDGATERGDTLTVAALAPVTNGLSAAAAEVANRTLYYQALYDPLLRAEPDGTLTPWLATEWSYNDDNTVLTLTLRDDVTFTNGDPLDADAVVENLLRFRDGPSPNANNLAAMTDATAPDATTVEIQLSEADPALLNYLAESAGYIQSPADFGTDAEDSNPTGSGPYILDVDDTVADSVYTYDANPDYWAPEYINYDELVIRVIEDATATVNAIRAGEIDAGTLITNDLISEVESVGWDIHPQELDWIGLTLVDRDGSMGSPLDDVRVRRALNHAFDRDAILEGIEFGYGTVTTQVFPPASPGFDEALDDLYPYDPELARELLAEAGYEDGFSLEMPSAAAFGEAYFAVIGDALAEIGVDVTFTDESTDYFAAILAPNYPAYLMILGQTPNDWQYINRVISENATWNPSGYTDETVSELVPQIRTASDDERDDLVAELGAHVTEDAWFVPWYRAQSTYATSDSVDVELQTGNNTPYLFSFSPQG
ncbi:MAG: ABC transporter substrate-binding protein [Actinomycetota bacterium]|nr:ABC transporter substrate-binding protein [Actinomycetota bacterium]